MQDVDNTIPFVQARVALENPSHECFVVLSRDDMRTRAFVLSKRDGLYVVERAIWCNIDTDDTRDRHYAELCAWILTVQSNAVIVPGENLWSRDDAEVNPNATKKI